MHLISFKVFINELYLYEMTRILIIYFQDFDITRSFQSYDYERTWRRLFQKSVLCIKLDIYLTIIINQTFT